MPLTDIQIRNFKPKEKSYKKSDSAGLYIEIMPTGKKLWRLKYYYLKKEKRISFGAYPLVSLSEAREKRDQAKKQLLNDIDPSKARKNHQNALTKQAGNTFKAVALEWFNLQKDRWSKGYAQKNMRILEMNLFPYIGADPIAKITPPDLLQCLRKVEKRGALDIARKSKQIAGMIFKYGIQTGKCEWNAAANLDGALRPQKTKHYAALEEKDLPLFLKALERNEARIFERTRRAVWFSLYTFQRPGEIRQAQWSEIDWDAKEWRISADKMKMRRDHIVPLSDQAIRILEEQHTEVEHLKSDWVFPSQVKPRNPMSDGTVNKAIQRLGFGKKTKAHGFRALARTLIREKLKYDGEIIEKQLAHKTKNPLGEAYDRTQFLDERKPMMQGWADYLDSMVMNNMIIYTDFQNRTKREIN